jgi:hypothetical protein
MVPRQFLVESKFKYSIKFCKGAGGGSARNVPSEILSGGFDPIRRMLEI